MKLSLLPSNQNVKCMNRWLIFNDVIFETKYQSYIAKDTLRYPKIIAFTLLNYGLFNILITIIENLISDFGSHKEKGWLISRLITIMIGCIIFGLMIFIIAKSNGISKKYSELLKLFLAILLQICLNESLVSQEINPIGYYLFWEAYQIQFYTFLITKIFKRWTYKIIYFFCSSIYFGIMKIQTTYDFLQIVREFGYCVIFGLVMYYMEKISRENFSNFQILLDKEIVWKKLLDYLPEDIVIVDNNGQIKYKNGNLFNDIQKDNEEKPAESDDVLNNIREKDELISQLTDLRVLNSIEDFKMRSKTTATQQELIKYKTNEIINHLNNIYTTEDPIMAKLKKRTRTLIEILSIINSNSNSIISIDLTFNGLYKDKSIELRIISTFFEGEKCFIMIIFDTTQRDKITKLEQNDKYKNRILSTASHQLRNPLNSSILMLQLAIDNESVSDKIKNE